MDNRTKLELTWIGKENRPRLEPRILIEDPALSYHAQHRVSENDIFDNRLIFGDNLLALKSLEQEFAGKIKCIFIDPPYNTGSAFTHYDDGVEHSIWLTMMRNRLEMLHKLLAVDGSLWITIDDNESHYLKVLCDEVFGRGNFIANVVWQKKASPQANAIWLSDSHDHVIVYAKDKTVWRPTLLPRNTASDSRYKNPDNDSRGVWTSGDCTISLTGGQRGAQFARTGYSANIYPIITPAGREILPPPGTCWRFSAERFQELVSEGRIYFGKSGNNVPRYKRFLSEVQEGIVCMTIWPRTEVGDNQEAKRETVAFNSEEVFSTPKPERLLQRIIHLASQPGELVLDSFAGSGTTGAVAHKMGRRWIMVELGEHCHTHIVPRLRKVIDGEDQDGISKAVGWNGGGGFRYYRLAPSVLQQDAWGNWVISKEYNAEMLAEAMCKHAGFTYAPSDTVYWQHGHSTERDFIYVTTQNLNHSQLARLSEEVGEDRTLLVFCTAFRAKPEDFQNLTIAKIPKEILGKCEYGRDDYSLRVSALPEAPHVEETPEEPAPKRPGKNGKDGDAPPLPLFEEEATA